MAGGMRMNDRQMKQAMKKMGIKQTSINDVTEVIIRTKTNEIVIRGADVVCVEMGGSKSYQISGVETIRELGTAGGSTCRDLRIRGCRSCHVTDRMRPREGCRSADRNGRTARRGHPEDHVGVITCVWQYPERS